MRIGDAKQSQCTAEPAEYQSHGGGTKRQHNQIRRAHPGIASRAFQQEHNTEQQRDTAAPAHRFEGLSAERFKLAFRNHPAGVSLITANGPAGPVALTASSVASVSAAPPLIVFSLSNASSSTPALLAADTVVIHLLDAGHVDLAKLGATSGIDRFADTDSWSPLTTGEPVFHNASNWIRGRILHRLEAGDATVIVVHALDAGLPEDATIAEPLVYHRRTWHKLGDHSRIEH